MVERVRPPPRARPSARRDWSGLGHGIGVGPAASCVVPCRPACDRKTGRVVGVGAVPAADTGGMVREKPGSDPLAHNADVRLSLLDWLSGIDQLGDEEFSQRALRGLIRRLDMTDSTEWDPTSARVQALTRAIAAAGRVLIRHKGFRDGHPG